MYRTWPTASIATTKERTTEINEEKEDYRKRKEEPHTKC